MAGPAAHRTSRLPPYSGTPPARLPLAAAAALAFALGGCAMSGQLGSLFAAKDKAGAPAAVNADATGSLESAQAAAAAAQTLPPESDLSYARAAIVELLSGGNKDTSVPWENPKSGARGTVTPIASAYAHDGVTCRNFLASYVSQGTEAWLHGEACRAKKGRWEVKSLKPWTRS
jgi:surface antigen